MTVYAFEYGGGGVHFLAKVVWQTVRKELQMTVVGCRDDRQPLPLRKVVRS
jgi:hypothetical protein